MTKDLFDRKKTKSDVYALAQELIQEILQEDSELGENLRDWIKKKWVRITSSGKIGGLAVHLRSKAILTVVFLKQKQTQ